MAIIGQTITQPLPTPSDPTNDPGPLYATKLKAFLDEVKSRLEASITQSSINIGGSLDFKSNPAVNMQYLGLANLSAGAGASPSLEVIAGELWFNDGAGNNVKLTSAGALNTASVGGFTGDYGLGSEEVIYTAASSLYEFMFGAGATDYADIKCDALETVGLATLNSLTTPAATVTGDLTVSGDIINGDVTKLVSVAGLGGSGGDGVAASFTNLYIPIEIPLGVTLKSVAINLYDVDTVGTWNWYIMYIDGTTGTPTTVSSGSGTHPSAGAYVERALTGLGHLVSSNDRRYFIKVSAPGSSVDHRCAGAHYIYEQL